MSDMNSLLEFSQNIADAEAPPCLPAGEYSAHCTKAEVGLSKSSQKPMITMSFAVNKSEFPVDFDGDQDQVVVAFYQPVEDNSSNRFRMKKLCEALGVSASNRIDANDFVSRTARIRLAIEPGLDGTPRNTMKGVVAE